MSVFILMLANPRKDHANDPPLMGESNVQPPPQCNRQIHRKRQSRKVPNPTGKLENNFQLVLKVIIHRRALILRNTLLLPIHLSHLSAASRHIGLLVISDTDEAREA